MTSSTDDEQNLLLSEFADDIDRINAVFYGRFPYPWRAFKLDRVLDNDFERTMLCQNFGDWSHSLLPKEPDIWVPGCGTNQAVITALKYPRGTVIGSDVSGRSLEICARTAQDLAVTNLELREESLNRASYRERFDYIICTGVLHHNSDPYEGLKRLSEALRRNGILELMVYNRFHRILPAAFQKAIRILAGPTIAAGDDNELHLAALLARSFPVDCQMAEFLRRYVEANSEQFADTLLQPLEFSYTVESLSLLAQSCDLQILTPCSNLIDQANGRSWSINFESAELNRLYYGLDDLRRWQVTNLLLCERSPMLWFYLNRINADLRRRSDRTICDAFLSERFTKVKARTLSYVLDASGKYHPIPSTNAYPASCRDQQLNKIVEEANGTTPMRTALARHGISTSFPEVNEIRLKLATSLNPYLKSI